MKVFQYNSKNKRIFFPDRYTNSISPKGDKFEFFINGVGFKKVSINKISSFEIEDMPKIDYSYIKEVYIKYGKDVTLELLRRCPEVKCCEMILSDYITIAMMSKNTSHLNYLKNKLNFDVFDYRDILISFGIWTFPIIELDNYCKKCFGYTEEKYGSLKDFLKKKFNFRLEF